MTLHLSHRAAYQAGLSLRDSVVLEHLLELTDLDEGVATVASSKYELARVLGMGADAVQRALLSLRDKGFIVRRQEVRALGWVAFTSLLPRAFALFGLPVPVGAADLPADIAGRLAGQPDHVIAAIAEAYAARDLPAVSVQSSFCGSSADWEALEALLRARMPLDEPADGLDADDMLAVPLDDGTEVAFDLRPLKALTDDGLDSDFLRGVLTTVARRRGVRDAASLASLLAEAAFSRARGFVCGHERGHAANVLAKVMGGSTWTRPRSITRAWYAAAARVRVELSTPRAATVH